MAVKVALLRTKSDGTKVYGLRINHNGKRKTVSVGTEAAANKAKSVAELQIAKGNLGAIEKTASPQFRSIAKNYLDFTQVSRSPKTHTRYSGLVRNYINKHIGKQPVDEITRGNIRDMLTKEYRNGASKSSIELMHTVCSNIFEFALDDGYIKSKPTSGILRKLELKRDKKDINPFTAEQIQNLINKIEISYQLFFKTSFQTGARVGELCALEWSHVNFAERTIKICQTADNQIIRKNTKTYLVRDVDMSENLAAALIEHKKKDKKDCFKKNIKQKYVFHREGKLYSQNTLLRRIQKACTDLGYGHHTVHDIRHTTASLLLAKGAPLPYVSKLLGHSSAKITLDVYSHYMPSENKGLVNLLDEGNNLQYKDNPV